MTRNDRVSLLFIKDKEVLLLFRYRKGREYYAFPGGGVDDGETLEQATVREAKEETNLEVSDLEKLFTVPNQGRPEHCFLVGKFSGTPKVCGPEAARQSPDNIYRLDWVPIDHVKNIVLVPEDMKNKVIDDVLNKLLT